MRLAVLSSMLVLALGLALPPLRRAVRAALEANAVPGAAPSPIVICTVEWLFAALLLVGAGILAGLLITTFVTNRLRRMALVLEQSTELNRATPHPFETGHHDEIGRLAWAMNVMHSRIRELVESVEGRDRERRQWLSRISHDLRTPLTALNACLNRARISADALPASEEREQLIEALKVAHLDSDRFHALASDLLDVARLEEEDVEIVREPVPPAELVRRVVASLKLLAEDLDIHIRVDAAESVPELLADGHRLARALENLLRNALYHGENEVVVSVERAGDSVQFAVCDDGPGLPTTEDGSVDLAALADIPGRRDSTGIGLMVARRVTAAHGGEIGGANRVGGGALVWFRIPRTEHER